MSRRNRKPQSPFKAKTTAPSWSFEKDLRDVGFSAAEIRKAWSCQDKVSRVSIELMALAAGLASLEDLGSEVVSRARDTIAFRVAAPVQNIDEIAMKIWREWEALTGRSLDERPASAAAVAVMWLVEDLEKKLGWAQCPPGNAGVAARIIVRRDIYSAVAQLYPQLADECRRQFREDWSWWREVKGLVPG